MKHLFTIAATLALLPIGLGACVIDERGAEIASERQALDNGPTGLDEARDFPRGTKVVMDPMYEQELVESGALEGAIAAGAPTLVYMNRMGGTFSPGQNNAATNRTTLALQTVNFPAANISNSNWNQVMSCVREQFSRFNVEITDTDPGAVSHYEAVIAGSPTLLGMPPGVGGVSPFTSNCDLIPNSVVFAFTEVLPNDPQIICEVAAQEIAHSFGLDHEYLCSDPMTYLKGCGAKYFQDVLAPCGEGSPRACAQPQQYDCGYTQQNSVQLLTARVGLREGGDTAIAAIYSPVDGATVSPGFEVRADVEGSASVEFRIDGNVVATLSSGPFYFSTPSELALGTHVLEIVVTKLSGTTAHSISINLSNDGPGGDSWDGSGGNATPVVTGGCSVSASTTDDTLMLLLLALTLLALRRRWSLQEQR